MQHLISPLSWEHQQPDELYVCQAAINKKTDRADM